MKDQTREKILKTLDDSCDPSGQLIFDIAADRLKSLIKSTLLDALPKEKGIKELKAKMGGVFNELDVQVAFKEGYNRVIRDIKDSLEGIV